MILKFFNTKLTSSSIPPKNIKIPAEANILTGKLLEDLAEYIEPIAQNIDLRVYETTPSGFKAEFTLNGFTRIIKPANPATCPKIVFPVIFCFRRRNS